MGEALAEYGIRIVNDEDDVMLITDKGTIIRIFHSQKGYLLQEVRRGKDKALIQSLNFDFSNKMLS